MKTGRNNMYEKKVTKQIIKTNNTRIQKYSVKQNSKSNKKTSGKCHNIMSCVYKKPKYQIYLYLFRAENQRLRVINIV